MKEKNYTLSNNLIEFSKKAKILDKKEEFSLITRWKENKEPAALQKILNAYLRLAISYSRKYSKYGLPIEDLIHEGVLGIMHALEKFDISKDFRLSTYASWWIRASIQDYILKNWSVVKTGSTASQKQLFFNLKKIKKQILDSSKEYMGQNEINDIAKMLKARPLDIQNMESRLASGDFHLNKPIGDEDGNDFISLLQDESKNPEELAESNYDSKAKNNWLFLALETLSDREKLIIKARKLKDKSSTLDDLGKKLNISKERVRQIETRALHRLKKAVLQISQQEKEFFI